MSTSIVEEIRSRKKQEQEYSKYIRTITPQLEPPFVKLLEDWESLFEETIHTDLRSDEEQLFRLANGQSKEFIVHLSQLRFDSPFIAKNPEAQMIIDRIILGEPLPIEEEIVTISRKSTTSTSTNTSTGEGTWSDPLNTEQMNPVPIGEHTLPPLPYPYHALEPYIDEKTMKIHHDKHHQTYVNDLNKAEKMMQEAREEDNFDLIKHWEREAAFNGAGHYLHTLFWNIMSPKGGGMPTGPIAEQIRKDFGSFDAFKRHFTAAADKVEGGGWTILVWSPRSHRLEILQAEKHQNLSQWDVVPLLAIDVWEHAYYLKHQNKRADYIKDWWNVVNWHHVNERFEQARKLKWQPY